MRIQFDETNLLAPMVAGNGLGPAEIREHGPRAVAALRAFRKAAVEDGRYGFPSLPFSDTPAREILAYAGQMRGSYDTVCLVGIGGSALGAWAIDCAIRGPHPVQGDFSASHPRLVILDNVDPDLTAAALDSMNPKKTLVLVIAKSGGTAETVATFLLVRSWLERKLGRRAASRIVAVTSRGRGELWTLASRQGYRTFEIPDNVGGRFSVLSPVGLLPAALTGVNILRLLRGASAMTKLCWEESLEKNTALRAALLHSLVWTLRNKPVQVAFAYSNRLWGMAFWFRQLWAESLGKAVSRDGRAVSVGQTPVAALGTTDQHSQVQLYMEGPDDKMFTFWAVRKFGSPGKIPKGKLNLEAFDSLAGRSLAELLEAERLATAAALTDQKRPNSTFTLDRVDEEHVGAFFQLLEFETAFAGELLNVNAFDQPGVELGKKYTYGLMGRRGYEEYRLKFREHEKRREEAARAARSRISTS